MHPSQREKRPPVFLAIEFKQHRGACGSKKLAAFERTELLHESAASFLLHRWTMPPVFVNLSPPSESTFARPLGLLSDCHRRIESFLTDMRCVATEFRGSALSDADRARLAGAVRYFTVAAPRHTSEEESLFPRMRAASDQRSQRALEELARLEADHDRADDCHSEANALANRWLNDGTLDAGAAERLIELLEMLAAIYAAHIAVEDSTVFPAAEKALDSHQLEAIGREMAARRGVDFDRVVHGRLAIEPPARECKS